jgi:hypothetical protein
MFLIDRYVILEADITFIVDSPGAIATPTHVHLSFRFAMQSYFFNKCDLIGCKTVHRN